MGLFPLTHWTGLLFSQMLILITRISLTRIPNQSLQSRYYLDLPKGVLFVCFALKLRISHSYFGSPLRSKKNVQSWICIHTFTMANSNELVELQFQVFRKKLTVPVTSNLLYLFIRALGRD